MTLLEFQRRAASAIMAPRSARSAQRAEANALVKRNARLTSLERVEIYGRSYWARVVSSLQEDFPGLIGILGPRAFDRLAKAYLEELPSRSFTLRDLGSRLADWLGAHPEWGGKDPALAVEMARLEWAHIEAYDAKQEKPLGPEDLIELGEELDLGLQPSIHLLELRYPVDDLRIAVTHGKSSAGRQARYRTRSSEAIFLALYRAGFIVQYRRLAPGEFRILEALRRGQSLGEAIETAAQTSAPAEEFQSNIQEWFASWSEAGWLCHRGTTTC